MKIHRCLFMIVILLFCGFPNAYAHIINYYEGYQGIFDRSTNTFYLCDSTETIHVSDPNQVETIQGQCPPSGGKQGNGLTPMRSVTPLQDVEIPLDNKVTPSEGKTPAVEPDKNGSGPK